MLKQLTQLWSSMLLPLGILVAFLLAGCGLFARQPATPLNHLLLGNPSKASTQTPNNYLIQKPQFVLSYNRSRGIPNWVSWQLNANWLGDVDRRDHFRVDETLPTRWPKVSPRDYTKSGYDRGHLAPAGDRTDSAADNAATFVMTNIVPQAPDVNRGPWVDLENYCRDLAEAGKELYIVAGGYGRKAAIADGSIIPPKRMWKVIVVLDRPHQGVDSVRDRTRVIAVDMPNRKLKRSTDWDQFTVSVDQLEEKTGYDFLTAISPVIQAKIEARVDRGES